MADNDKHDLELMEDVEVVLWKNGISHSLFVGKLLIGLYPVMCEYGRYGPFLNASSISIERLLGTMKKRLWLERMDSTSLDEVDLEEDMLQRHCRRPSEKQYSI